MLNADQIGESFAEFRKFDPIVICIWILANKMEEEKMKVRSQLKMPAKDKLSFEFSIIYLGSFLVV